MKEDNRFNTYGNDYIVCPYCGCKEEDDISYEERDCEEYDCAMCGETFLLTTEHEVKFTTSCKKHKLFEYRGIMGDREARVEVIGGQNHRYYHCENCHHSEWMTEEEVKQHS